MCTTFLGASFKPLLLFPYAEKQKPKHILINKSGVNSGEFRFIASLTNRDYLHTIIRQLLRCFEKRKLSVYLCITTLCESFIVTAKKELPNGENNCSEIYHLLVNIFSYLYIAASFFVSTAIVIHAHCDNYFTFPVPSTTWQITSFSIRKNKKVFPFMKYVVEITATFVFFNIFPKQKTNFCIKDEQNFLKMFAIISSVTLTFPAKKYES